MALEDQSPQSNSVLFQGLIKTGGLYEHDFVFYTTYQTSFSSKSLQIKIKGRDDEEGKNSSQAICLCQNLQKKLTESFFSFSLFSWRREKKLNQSLAKTGLSILELLCSHGQKARPPILCLAAKEKFRTTTKSQKNECDKAKTLTVCLHICWTCFNLVGE